jgi:ribosome-associated protein
MEEIQEKSLHRETAAVELVQRHLPFTDLDGGVQLAVSCADDKKATRITVLDLRPVASFTEFFVIADGANQRQVQAIADEINEQLKKQYGRRPVRIEGYKSAEWVLLDYGDFIVHLFNKEARDFYDLERLWRDAGKVDLPESLKLSAG